MKLSKKIIAVMDLGSQTFRLATAICTSQGIGTVGSWLENVRLGEGLSTNPLISDEAMARGTSALEKFKRILDWLKEENKAPVTLWAVGTAALRRAENAPVFIERAASMNMDIEIISGKREAEITAVGVAYTLEEFRLIKGNPPVKLAIIDAGGGSTEISLCGATGILSGWTSMDMGAVKLTEEFLGNRTSPPDASAVEAMNERIESVLLENRGFLEHASTQAAFLAGAGGTVTTAAAMETGMKSYDPSKIRGLMLSRETMQKWITRLARKTKSEKDSICGLEPERSDIILSGILIIHGALTLMGFQSLTVSDGGLLLGLLISAIKKECTSHAEPSCSRGLYV